MTFPLAPLFAFGIGMPGLPEMMIIGIIILLLFGNRLPSVMRSMGKGITEFKKGVQGIEDDIDQAVKNGDKKEGTTGGE